MQSKNEVKNEEIKKETKVIPLNKKVEQKQEKQEMMVSIPLESVNSYIGLLSTMLEGDDRLKGLTNQLIKIIQASNPDLAEKKAG